MQTSLRRENGVEGKKHKHGREGRDALKGILDLFFCLQRTVLYGALITFVFT